MRWAVSRGEKEKITALNQGGRRREENRSPNEGQHEAHEHAIGLRISARFWTAAVLCRFPTNRAIADSMLVRDTG